MTDSGPSADALIQALDAWIGQWPPPTDGVTVIGSTDREQPGWDGSIRALVGVTTPHVGSIIAVPPGLVDQVRSLGSTIDEIGPGIAEVLGQPEATFGAGVFRTTSQPLRPATVNGNADPGVWVARSDPRVPEWLHPFNGDVLVAFEPGSDGAPEVAAGIGVKKHNDWAHEIAVVTEEAHRGKGLAKALVGQAAQRILDDGAVPIYLHGEDNIASAKTADACGFFDEGWRILGLFS